MFTPHICRQKQLVTINTFGKDTLRWNNSELYPSKYENFHSCAVYIAKFPTSKFMLSFFTTIAEFHNFRCVRIPPMDIMEENDMDFDMHPYDISATPLIFGIPLFYFTMVFLIPPGEPYTTVERMFLMFDFEVWIAILVTFMVAIISIQVINLMSVKIQNFVFGKNIQTPTLNLTSTFFAGYQTKTPGRNFARFLLMLFIIWSLIIRTCYQSELFTFLQADIRKPPVATINELIERNFTVYTVHSNERIAPYLPK